MERLKRRASFKAVARGRRAARPGFVLQALTRVEPVDGATRIGFTVTRQMGNAVVRNRIRRRLREAVRRAGDKADRNTDYVLVGRRAALTLPFERLVTDLLSGFDTLRTGGRPKTGPDAR